MGHKTADKAIYKFLRLDGKPAGSANMAVDGDPGPINFKAGPTGTQVWEITRIIFHLRDNVAGMKPEEFGGISALGAKACQLGVMQAGTEVLDFTNGLDIAANQDFGRICYDLAFVSGGSGANANTALQSRFTFAKAGHPILLQGWNKDEIFMGINADIDAVLEFTAQIQGYQTQD